MSRDRIAFGFSRMAPGSMAGQSRPATSPTRKKLPLKSMSVSSPRRPFGTSWQSDESYHQETGTFYAALPVGSPGDRLVAFVVRENDGGLPFTAPTGWTIARTLSSSTYRMVILSKSRGDDELTMDISVATPPSVRFNFATVIANVSNGSSLTEASFTSSVTDTTFEVTGSGFIIGAIYDSASGDGEPDLTVTPYDSTSYIAIPDDGDPLLRNSQLRGFSYMGLDNPVFTTPVLSGAFIPAWAGVVT